VIEGEQLAPINDQM